MRISCSDWRLYITLCLENPVHLMCPLWIIKLRLSRTWEGAWPAAVPVLIESSTAVQLPKGDGPQLLSPRAATANWIPGRGTDQWLQKCRVAAVSLAAWCFLHHGQIQAANPVKNRLLQGFWAALGS